MKGVYMEDMEQDTKQCPFCGKIIKAKALKCKFCNKWFNDENKEQEEKDIVKTKNCPVCGEEILAVAKKCKYCGEILDNDGRLNTFNYYNSPQKQLPYEIQRFNWGAFYFHWIWGIYNNCYMTFWSFASLLLVFVPFIGSLAPLGFSIWFGIKGNEWAWNNKEWKDIEHFNSVQITWAKATIVATIITLLLFVVAGISSALFIMYASIFALSM